MVLPKLKVTVCKFSWMFLSRWSLLFTLLFRVLKISLLISGTQTSTMFAGGLANMPSISSLLRDDSHLIFNFSASSGHLSFGPTSTNLGGHTLFRIFSASVFSDMSEAGAVALSIRLCTSASSTFLDFDVVGGVIIDLRSATFGLLFLDKFVAADSLGRFLFF